MAVNAQKVYEMALTLIDEVGRSGAIDQSDLSIRTKVINILTTLQAELMPNALDFVIVTSMDDIMQVSDRECLLVLPYGVAAHLLIQEDATTASFFQQRYEEMRKKKRATIQQTVQVLPVNGVSTPVDPAQEATDEANGNWDGGEF